MCLWNKFLLSANVCYKLKNDKGTDSVFSWKSKGYILLDLRQYIILFLHSIKLPGYKVGKRFIKDPLAVELNKCTTKIVILYIIYELYACPKAPFDNFKTKKLLRLI